MKNYMTNTKFVKHIPLWVCDILPRSIYSTLLAFDYALTLRDARKNNGMPPVSLLREFNQWSHSTAFSGRYYPVERLSCPALGVEWGHI